MAVKKFTVEASHIMMFARAVGDGNPVYHDADHAKNTEVGGIIAPPTFAQASAQFDPDYGLRPKVDGDGWFGSGGKPSGAKPRPRGGGGGSGEESGGGGGGQRSGGGGGGGGLHAEQRFIYHRHLKPGDVLSATGKPGKTWEKQGRRSGKLVFSESITEYRDQNGELVVTAIGVGVRTERPVDQS